MKIKGLRWWVVGLVALAAVVNYIDRQAIAVLWPEISKELYPDVQNAEEFEDMFPDVFQDVYPQAFERMEEIRAEEDLRRAEGYQGEIRPIERPRLSLDVLESANPEVYATIAKRPRYADASDASELRKSILSTITIVFMFAYALGQATFGKIFDWVGTRIGFAISIGAWSIATALHALAKGVVSFSIFRGLLGLAEAGAWPGAAKANAEWFPTKERAFAQGIFNSGAAIGGLIAFPIVGFLSIYMSWQAIFVTVALLGFIWLIPWLVIVKGPPAAHSWLNDSERQYILSGQLNQDQDGDGSYDDGYNPGTGEMLSRRQSWGVIVTAATIDPIWWLFITWIPTYLAGVYGMNIKEIALFGWVPFAGGMLGAWFGGLFAQNRIKAGWSVSKTRKITISMGCMLMFASLLVLINPGGPTVAVIVMGVTLFGFQTAIGNVQTLPSDFFGGKSVGSLAGYAGMAAKLGAAGLTFLIPVLTRGENYTPVFIIAAALAIIAMASVWVLCGEIKPLKPRSVEAE